MWDEKTGTLAPVMFTAVWHPHQAGWHSLTSASNFFFFLLTPSPRFSNKEGHLLVPSHPKESGDFGGATECQALSDCHLQQMSSVSQTFKNKKKNTQISWPFSVNQRKVLGELDVKIKIKKQKKENFGSRTQTEIHTHTDDFFSLC